MEEDSRDCMSHKIKRAIIERIAEGTYAAGERLTELRLAREFNTSQAPVREALSQLETMRIVETEPYKGTRVREITRKELEECLMIRASLENLAAELAGTAILEKLDELRAAAEEALKAAKAKSPKDYAIANLQFHRIIVEASGSDTLISVWNSLAPELRMLASCKDHVENLCDAAHDHFEIVDAFADGDNRFAGRLLRKHAESALAMNLKPQDLAI
jgi:DNA-binding GntR family transcriptional regulator